MSTAEELWSRYRKPGERTPVEALGLCVLMLVDQDQGDAYLAAAVRALVERHDQEEGVGRYGNPDASDGR